MPKPIANKGKAVSAARANAAEAHLKKAFKGQGDAPKLAKLKAARTKGDYLQALCELHGVALADVERVRL